MSQLSRAITPSRNAARQMGQERIPSLALSAQPSASPATIFRSAHPSSERPRTLEITDSMILTDVWHGCSPRERDASQGSARDELIEGTMIKERYSVTGLLGQGGIGQVYSARDLETDNIVVVKIALPSLSVETTGKFMKREADTLSQVDHENVVRYIDRGIHHGRSFVVMEYIDGPSLNDRLSAGMMGLDQAIGIIEQLCDALDAVHGRGIVHRDLKFDNILLDRFGKVKLTDFGIAAYEGMPEDLAAPGAVLGTPAYMAPEQCEGSISTRGIDVHAVGVMLYCMVTGEHPFMSRAMRERTLDGEAAGFYGVESEATRTMVRVMTMVPPAPSALLSGLPHELDAIVGRAMAKTPEERYQDIRELKSDIAGLRGRLRSR